MKVAIWIIWIILLIVLACLNVLFLIFHKGSIIDFINNALFYKKYYTAQLYFNSIQIILLNESIYVSDGTYVIFNIGTEHEVSGNIKISAVYDDEFDLAMITVVNSNYEEKSIYRDEIKSIIIPKLGYKYIKDDDKVTIKQFSRSLLSIYDNRKNVSLFLIDGDIIKVVFKNLNDVITITGNIIDFEYNNIVIGSRQCETDKPMYYKIKINGNKSIIGISTSYKYNNYLNENWNYLHKCKILDIEIIEHKFYNDLINLIDIEKRGKYINSIGMDRKEGSTVGVGNVAAEGYETTASGNYYHAEGWDTTASGKCSHAEGSFSQMEQLNKSIPFIQMHYDAPGGSGSICKVDVDMKNNRNWKLTGDYHDDTWNYSQEKADPNVKENADLLKDKIINDKGE